MGEWEAMRREAAGGGPEIKMSRMPETASRGNTTFSNPPWEQLRLSRKERDHIAGHALDELTQLGLDLHHGARNSLGCSDVARKIAVLSNLLGDIGWEREAFEGEEIPEREFARSWSLGELFPVAQLRPWLEEWQRQDNEALDTAEGLFKGRGPEDGGSVIADAQTKLGTGAILLARIEKWMASHGN